MKRVFDSPFLNKAALVLIWLLLMGGTFFYANKNYFLYHENPNLIKQTDIIFIILVVRVIITGHCLLNSPMKAKYIILSFL